MKHIVKVGKQYLIFKTFEKGSKEYSRIVKKTKDLKSAKQLCEDGEGGVPANNVGSGNIAGVELGYPINKFKKMFRRRKRKV